MKLSQLQSNYNIEEIVIRRSRIYRCRCKRQLCKGRYIRTRLNQKQCLGSYTKEELERMTPLWLMRSPQKKLKNTLKTRKNGESPASYIGQDTLTEEEGNLLD